MTLCEVFVKECRMSLSCCVYSVMYCLSSVIRNHAVVLGYIAHVAASF